MKIFLYSLWLAVLVLSFSTTAKAELQSRHKIYGVIDSTWEKSGEIPTGVDTGNRTVRESIPWEFGIPNLTVMFQGTFMNRFRYFLTLSGPGSEYDSNISMRNAWIQSAFFGELLNVRIGKLYRKFGLYNEILDSVPTYLGTEAPELFDETHLLLPRTTNFMIHGRWNSATHALTYAIMTGNDERAKNQVPLGLDLNYIFNDIITLGTSFYSTNGEAKPSHLVGNGPTDGAVMPWMKYDKYYVFGGYLQYEHNNILLQYEFWQARHNGERDPNEVIKLQNADLNPRQQQRFGLGGAAPTVNDVITNSDYKVTTTYLRFGYTFELNWGDLIPYIQYDWYRNPETIRLEEFGGDNQAGLSYDGEFHKATLGLLFRPLPNVALKADWANQIFQFNGVTEWVPKVRVSFSYLWSALN